MVSMMRFKLIAGEAYICFLVVFAFDSNLVYDVSGYQASLIQRAVGL